MVLAVAAGLLVGAPSAEAWPAAADVPGSGTGVAATSISNNTFERRVQRQVNKRRAARDLPKVRIVSECLDGYAEDWAETIAQTGLMVHRDQTVILASCELSWAGENLARGTDLTPKSTVKAWMDSPDHRAVLLKRRANRAGIGVRKDGEDRTVVVLNFGDK
jgi:uncharacterized protein YkwD